MTHEDLEKRLAELDQRILALEIKVETLQRFVDNFNPPPEQKENQP